MKAFIKFLAFMLAILILGIMALAFIPVLQS